MEVRSREIDALAACIGENLKLSAPVTIIEDDPTGKFRVNDDEYDAVVVATPAFVAANLIDNRDPQLSQTLREVNYPQLAVVILGFESGKIAAKLDGFGFLIASKENRPILGTLFHSAVFPERAPAGHQLLVTFVGGVRSGNTLDARSDEELKALVLEQLGDILGVSGEPDFVHIKRWKKAIPQYRVGYEDVTEACSAFETNNPGLYFCSNFYRGVSMGDCVKNAFDTAERIEEYLKV